MDNFLKNVIKTSQNYKAIIGYRNYQISTDCARIHAVQSSFDYGDELAIIEGTCDRQVPDLKEFLKYELQYSSSCFFSLEKDEKTVLTNFLKAVEKQPDGLLIEIKSSEIFFSYSGKKFNFEFKPWNSQIYTEDFEFKMNPKFILDLIKSENAWYFTNHEKNIYFKSEDGTKKAILCPLSE